MAKKSDSFYFDNFSACADYSLQAARMLSDLMHNFDPTHIDEALEKMHAIEQAADEKKHEISDALITAFITPIEREDIALLSDNLDAVTDHIEGILHRLYFDNIQSIRPDALETVSMLVRACESMCVLVNELPQFKRSKALRQQVIAINSIEEEADTAFVNSMRTLHTTETDPLQVIAWRDIYMFLEYSADSCEHVAEAIDNIVMKNS